MPSEVVDTGAAHVWFEDEIVHIRSKGVRSTPASVAKTLAAAEQLTGGEPRPILFDAREWPGGEPAAWITVIEGMDAGFTAAAMLFDEGSYPEVGKYPETIDRLVIPFRVFSDRAEALAFLDSNR